MGTPPFRQSILSLLAAEKGRHAQRKEEGDQEGSGRMATSEIAAKKVEPEQPRLREKARTEGSLGAAVGTLPQQLLGDGF